MSWYCILLKHFFRCVFAAALFTLALRNSEASATAIAASKSGLCLELDAASGTYRVISKEPAWTLGGSLGVSLKSVTTSRAHDGVGDGRQISFEWRDGQTPMRGQIRLYNEKPLALFSQTCGAATETPPAAFPAFTKLPDSLHVFSYGHHEFAPPHFSTNEICTPWLLFDDQANAFLISPASHFLVASID